MRAQITKKNIPSYPDFNLMDYDTSLAKNLMYYNLDVDLKQKKDWALEFYKSQGKPVDKLKRLSEGYFSTLGAVVHLFKHRGVELDNKHRLYIENKYPELMRIVPTEVEKASPVIIERTKEQANEIKLIEHIAEFEAMLDYRNAVTVEVFAATAKSYLLQHEVKAPISKKIGTWFKPKLREIMDVLNAKDDQLVEAYSFMSRREQKKMADCLQALISACELSSAIVRAAKSPRKQKTKSAVELCKTVKFLQDLPELKLKSIRPEKIIGSSEIWIYNPTIRRLFRYTALPGHSLSVKGTTLINIDPAKSGGKILRKPEEQLKEVEIFTSRPMNKLFDGIRATESKGTGRLNDESLILKCFN